jgi:arabinose-5-phosphate isomerase
MIESGRRVFDIEIESLRAVRDGLDERFSAAARAVMECRGKVIVTGLGKSGAIGRKIAATFSSTGTPAAFLHATEGVHGDLGIIDRNDLVIAISYSGEQNELAQIIPAIKRLEVVLIAITGNPASTLGKAAEIVLPVTVPQEACPLGLAPTSSTTATLAMGDALAVSVYEARGFTAEDFAFRHPGGALGRSLLRVSDLMHTGDQLPLCSESAAMGDVILEMTRKKLGMTCVVDASGKLAGIITDGDLRRLIQRDPNLLSRTAAECMTRSPKTVEPEILAVRALTLMEDRQITSLVVAEPDGRLSGVIHIHDILRSKVI